MREDSVHMRWKLLPVLAFVSLLTGCAMSRADKLEAKSERVEKALLTEQRRIIETQDAERQARLDHLTQLRALLSAANISLGVVPHTVPADKRDIAYDVLDEAYDTIHGTSRSGLEIRSAGCLGALRTGC